MIIRKELPPAPPPPPRYVSSGACDGCGAEAYQFPSDSTEATTVPIPKGWLWVRVTSGTDVAYLCTTCRQGALLRLADGREVAL